MAERTMKCIVPEWTIDFLINRDTYGLEPRELDAIHGLEDNVGLWARAPWQWGEVQSAGFRRQNNLTGPLSRVACRCVEIEAIAEEEA